jgi:hypothetical protein
VDRRGQVKLVGALEIVAAVMLILSAPVGMGHQPDHRCRAGRLEPAEPPQPVGYAQDAGPRAAIRGRAYLRRPRREGLSTPPESSWLVGSSKLKG